MFLGKGVLKICSKFTGKHPCNTLWHGCSPVNLLHIFSTRFYKKHIWKAASANTQSKNFSAWCRFHFSYKFSKFINKTHVNHQISDAESYLLDCPCGKMDSLHVELFLRTKSKNKYQVRTNYDSLKMSKALLSSFRTAVLIDIVSQFNLLFFVCLLSHYYSQTSLPAVKLLNSISRTMINHW